MEPTPAPYESLTSDVSTAQDSSGRGKFEVVDDNNGDEEDRGKDDDGARGVDEKPEGKYQQVGRSNGEYLHENSLAEEEDCVVPAEFTIDLQRESNNWGLEESESGDDE